MKWLVLLFLFGCSQKTEEMTACERSLLGNKRIELGIKGNYGACEIFPYLSICPCVRE